MNKIKINIDPTDKILLKRELGNNGKAQLFFTSEVRRLADPYTPFESGTLKNTAKVDVNKITYVAPYSAKNYYENKGMGEQGTGKGGLRGKQWIPRMWADRGKEIIKSIAKLTGGRTG